MIDPREWKQLLFNAEMKLTGSSQRGVTAEAYDVLKEFFVDSNSWREDIRFQAEQGVTSYLIAPLDGGTILRLIGVFDVNWTPQAAFMPEFGTISLPTAPNSTPTDPWTARVVKTVGLPIGKEGEPDAPSWVLTVYGVHILDGILGKMMSEANKSWSDPVKSAYHLRRFRAGIQLARTATVRANLVGAQEWSFPRNATAGSQRGGAGSPWPRGS